MTISHTTDRSPTAQESRSTDATDATLGTELVDALNGVFGRHPARAVHAKGIVLEGTFAPSATAKTFSVAPHLQSTTVPVVVRFSNFNAVPQSSDVDPTHGPRGMALKFHLPDGTATDIVAHSFNGFPTATAEEFRDLFRALAASAPGAPSPTPAERFLATRPAAKAFLEAPNPPPVSYATLRYFGVNTFVFTNAVGRVTNGRYVIDPAAGVQLLPESDLTKVGPGYLREEIQQRVGSGPVTFALGIQIAEAGDKLDDPSIPWPASRIVVPLGVVTLAQLADDDNAAAVALSFSPSALPAGIAPGDPMIVARDRAYAVSFDRRTEAALPPMTRTVQ